ncbi:hypothetical protein BDQ17DRAFT_1335695 [Cyathus striatus]|nr:hypothetical protein BDQ17DRAFT_1335695 [Cyathus striatus]
MYQGLGVFTDANPTQPPKHLQKIRVSEHDILEFKQKLADWDEKTPQVQRPAELHPVVKIYHAVIDMLLVIAEANYQVPHTISGSGNRLTTWVSLVDKDIKVAANAIGVYCDECHFVKFLKASQWKEEFKLFIDLFRQQREDLQVELHFATLANVGEINRKIDAFLNTPFKWETSLVNRAQMLGVVQPLDIVSIKGMPENMLAKLVVSAGGPGTNGIDSKLLTLSNMDLNEKRKIRQVIGKLRTIKEEIETPLPQLFEESALWFEKSLNKHTKQIENALNRAHDLIIHHLHELSKRLYSKMFISTLFEYYLERFSGRRCISYPESDETALPVTRQATKTTMETSVVTPSILTETAYRLKSNYISHPDAWTLEYFITNGKISEANEFTEKPRAFGMSLPQWCVYCAAGWQYELRIHQARIQSLIQCMLYQLMIMLPENRNESSIILTGYFIRDLILLSRGPLTSPWTILGQLQELVNDKVKKQDFTMQTELRELKYFIKPNDIIKFLVKDSAFEFFSNLIIYKVLLGGSKNITEEMWNIQPVMLFVTFAEMCCPVMEEVCLELLIINCSNMKTIDLHSRKGLAVANVKTIFHEQKHGVYALSTCVQNCADTTGDVDELPKIYPLDSDGHQWWHTVLYIPYHSKSPPPEGEILPLDGSGGDDKAELTETIPRTIRMDFKDFPDSLWIPAGLQADTFSLPVPVHLESIRNPFISWSLASLAGILAD